MKKLLLLSMCVFMITLCGCQDDKIILDITIDQFGLFDEMNMAAFKSNGKWGYVSVDKGIIVNPEYNDVTPFYHGYSIVHKDLKSQIVDRAGAFVLKDWIDSYVKYDEIKEEFYYFNESNKEIIELEKIYEPENKIFGTPDKWMKSYSYIKQNKGVNLIHKETNKLIFDDSYELLREVISNDMVDNDEYYFIIRNGDLMGISKVVGDTSKVLAYDNFEKVSFFENQQCMIFETNQDKWLYNLDGELILSSTESVKFESTSFNNRIAIRTDGLWGYIESHSGKVIVKPTYYRATDYYNGYAVCKPSKNSSKLVVIDTNGSIVIETKDY